MLFECFSKFFKLSPWVRASRDFGRTLKVGVKLFLNCLRTTAVRIAPEVTINVRGAKMAVN